MAESMLDNVEYDLALIAEVERSPLLYDSSHMDFKCNDLKLDKWKEVAFRLRQNTDDTSGMANITIFFEDFRSLGKSVY